jgi:hypothetical protein
MYPAGQARSTQREKVESTGHQKGRKGFMNTEPPHFGNTPWLVGLVGWYVGCSLNSLTRHDASTKDETPQLKGVRLHNSGADPPRRLSAWDHAKHPPQGGVRQWGVV